MLDSGAPWERARTSVAELASAGERAVILDEISPAALRVAIATDATLDDDLVGAIRQYLDHDRAITSALDGTAVQAMGCPAGPAVGEVLRALRVARIDQTVVDESAEKALARSLIATCSN